MAESLVLFDLVVNLRWFLRTSIVLFLTKLDIFQDKLRGVSNWRHFCPFFQWTNRFGFKVPLERYFQEYTGGPNVDTAAKFILWRFLQMNTTKCSVYPQYSFFAGASGQKLTIHDSLIQTIDTSSVQLVFAAVKETVFNNLLGVRDILQLHLHSNILHSYVPWCLSFIHVPPVSVVTFLPFL
jgi:guanine nucleotide-binding protein G(i) subunit alpha